MLRSLDHPLKPGPSPLVLTMSRHWVQMGLVKGVRLTLRNFPSLKSKLSAQVMAPVTITCFQPLTSLLTLKVHCLML